MLHMLGYGGAITAALFLTAALLQMPDSYIHFDIYSWAGLQTNRDLTKRRSLTTRTPEPYSMHFTKILDIEKMDPRLIHLQTRPLPAPH